MTAVRPAAPNRVIGRLHISIKPQNEAPHTPAPITQTFASVDASLRVEIELETILLIAVFVTIMAENKSSLLAIMYSVIGRLRHRLDLKLDSWPTQRRK